jgi:ABC-type dipeptide/oligopeptide/nickel transport system permease component
MKPPIRHLLFWSPRVLTLLFTVCLSLFALDVFDEGLGFWGTIVALFMHLIPTWIVLLVLALSWRWEWIGAVLLVVLGLLYVPLALGRGHPEWTLIISGPLFLMGGLFLVNWLKRKEIRASS